jgi:hypothetical protein
MVTIKIHIKKERKIHSYLRPRLASKAYFLRQQIEKNFDFANNEFPEWDIESDIINFILHDDNWIPKFASQHAGCAHIQWASRSAKARQHAGCAHIQWASRSAKACQHAVYAYIQRVSRCAKACQHAGCAHIQWASRSAKACQDGCALSRWVCFLERTLPLGFNPPTIYHQ